MKFAKKILRKKKKDKQQINESWYNNSHEIVKKSKWVPMDDPGSLASPNSYYVSISHANERR